MKFTPEVSELILARIAERVSQGKAGKCPICQRIQWQLQPGFASMFVTEDASVTLIGGPAFRCVVLVCTICGNTHFLALKALGLEELLKPENPPGLG